MRLFIFFADNSHKCNIEVSIIPFMSIVMTLVLALPDE